MIYVYYSINTVLLALVDALRMKRKNSIPNPVGNNDISHAVSRLLAAIAAIILYFAVNGWHFTLQSICYPFACLAIRFSLFDLFNNIFVNFFVFPRPIAYISGKSTSINEQRLTHVSFLMRRVIAAAALALILITQYVFIK